MHDSGAEPALPLRRAGRPDRRSHRRDTRRRSGRLLAAGCGEGRPAAAHRQGDQRLSLLSCGAQRHRRAEISRLACDVRARCGRRSRRTTAARRRHAAHRRAADECARAAGGTDRTAAAVHARLGNRRAVRPAWRSGFLHRKFDCDLLRHRLGSALQLQPSGRAPERAETGVDAQRRWRSRPASVQCARLRVRDRQHQLHRRHAGDPHARWAQPGRLRLCRNDRESRAVESRSGEAGRSHSLQAHQLRRRSDAGESAGPRDRCAHGDADARADGAGEATQHRVGMRDCGTAGTRFASAGGVSPGRRSQPVARIRADGAGPALASAHPRIDAGTEGESSRRHSRTLAGRTLATDSVRQPQAAAGQTDRRAARGRRVPAGCRVDEGADAHRAPADGLAGFGDARRSRTLPPVGARHRTVAAEQCRVHASHQRARQRRRRSPHRVRNQLHGAGSGRCLSRRAVCRTSRSASPTADLQIQPGAHLYRRRHRWYRRRLHVHLWHGLARRLSADRPHLADLEQVPEERAVRQRRTLAAEVLRSGALLRSRGSRTHRAARSVS